jgi:hypothetical protein
MHQGIEGRCRLLRAPRVAPDVEPARLSVPAGSGCGIVA